VQSILLPRNHRRATQASLVQDFGYRFEPVAVVFLAWAPTSLLCRAGTGAGLVRVHRNVIPAVRENVKLAEAILQSYADVPDFDPREQRWMIAKR
jgi:hypothetical protein